MRVVLGATEMRDKSNPEFRVKKVGWGQSWLFGKPAVSGFFDKKTAVSGFPAGFLGNHLRLRIALITYI